MELTIITTSPHIAIAIAIAIAAAAGREGVKVMLIGGALSNSAGGVTGAEALSQVQRLRVDVGIPGACAVDPATGIWAMDAEDAALKRCIVAASARVLVTAASEKLGAQGNYHVATTAEVDDVVLDALAPAFHRQAFVDAGLAVHQVGG